MTPEQREKRRLQQAAANKRFREKNPDYWRTYYQTRRLQQKATNETFRKNNPDYWRDYHTTRHIKRPGYAAQYYQRKKLEAQRP